LFGDNNQYQKEMTDIMTDYMKNLNKQAKVTFGCDAKCVDSCTNTDVWNYMKADQCIHYTCQCNFPFIKVEPSKMNLAALQEYNDQDENAWAFFTEEKKAFEITFDSDKIMEFGDDAIKMHDKYKNWMETEAKNV